MRGTATALRVETDFDSGSIELAAPPEPGSVRLRLVPDAGGHRQWFHFRLSGLSGGRAGVCIENAGEAAFPRGFEGYQAAASYDGAAWFRVPTRFEEGALWIDHAPAHAAVTYAYAVPYPLARTAALLKRCEAATHLRVETLAHTPDGHPLALVQAGEPAPGRRACWLIGRQHPGETPAAWWLEGALERLLDAQHPQTAALLQGAVLYVVPNMNPDGSQRGYLRTNAAGTNLNRAWAEPSLEASPEVLAVRERMHATGVDFCLDVHADEALPYVFAQGCEGIPSLTERQSELLEDYRHQLLLRTPHFQTRHGYGRMPPGRASMALCTNYVAETFGCLAMTLEQPIKDDANWPDAQHGWSPARARHLAHACLEALGGVLPRLR